MQRTAEACGVGLRTLTSIKKKVSEAHKQNQPLQFRVMNRKCVKRKIYDMQSKRLHVTVKALQQGLALSGVLSFSISSLKRLLPTIGFTFKNDDSRRGLFELKHVAAAQVKFLREYELYKHRELYDPVFLDESWIFSRDSAKKSWIDNTKQSIKKKPFGEGKRFIVLHAGNKDRFVPNASLLFSTKSPSADYHGDMNAELFTKWFQEPLIPNLNQTSLIILSYYSKLMEKCQI